MPEKHPATIRHGGPGASHEDRSKPLPVDEAGSPKKPDHLDHRSGTSSGGGENDSHHTHNPPEKGGRV